MSMEAMTSLLEKARSDEAFAEALTAAVGDRQGDDAIDAVVAFGKANGFDVTAEGAREARRNFAAIADDGEGELDDDALEGVSGGAEISYTSPFDLFKGW